MFKKLTQAFGANSEAALEAADKLNALSALLQAGGMTVNQARAALDLEGILEPMDDELAWQMMPVQSSEPKPVGEFQSIQGASMVVPQGFVSAVQQLDQPVTTGSRIEVRCSSALFPTDNLGNTYTQVKDEDGDHEWRAENIQGGTLLVSAVFDSEIEKVFTVEEMGRQPLTMTPLPKVTVTRSQPAPEPAQKVKVVTLPTGRKFRKTT